MGQIFKNLKAFSNNIMGFSALDVGNKPDSTSLFLKSRIVEALAFWKSVGMHIIKLLNLHPRCQSFSMMVGARVARWEHPAAYCN
jgi:hypothetical protein